jgi:SAM-dependent methyltransferase
VVSGLDFSAAAIDAARSLADSLGVSATFVVSDVYEAASAFGGQRFDIVYTGVGALCWLPSVPRWASAVASLVAPGGFLYLVEGHPFAEVLEESDAACVVSRDYFDSKPQVWDYPCTYTDGPELTATRSVEFQHTMGSVITSLIEAGLRIEFVHEYGYDAFRRFESMEPGEDGLYRFPPGRPRVPMLYSLRASRSRPGSAGD